MQKLAPADTKVKISAPQVFSLFSHNIYNSVFRNAFIQHGLEDRFSALLILLGTFVVFCSFSSYFIVWFSRIGSNYYSGSITKSSLSSWISYFRRMWVSKKEWEDEGKKILHKKFL